jgi:hypothetical protein
MRRVFIIVLFAFFLFYSSGKVHSDEPAQTNVIYNLRCTKSFVNTMFNINIVLTLSTVLEF